MSYVFRMFAVDAKSLQNANYIFYTENNMVRMYGVKNNKLICVLILK